jgi:CheY-like chemotaxis protein
LKVTLTVLQGPLKGQVAVFEGPGTFLIGRDSEADYRLPEDDRCVSRRHIRLEIRATKCRVLDIGTTGYRSLNPPRVNGHKVALDAELNDGDILELGQSQFQVAFHARSEPAPASCPACGRPLRHLKGHAEPQRCPACQPPRKRRTWAEGTTVLAVEDDPLTARLIRASLEKEGLKVLEATNGRDALTLLNQHEVHLVSTDLIMPAMDGLWLIREIRDHGPERTASVPIIVLTINAGEEDMLRCLSAGADDYLTKPISPQVFIQKLWRLYRRSRA